MKHNAFAIKINLLVLGIIALVTLGSQINQPQAAEVETNIYKVNNVGIDLAFKGECDKMYRDLEKYVSRAEVELQEHKHADARKTFNHKIKPKHNKWKRYCKKLYSEKINSKEEKSFITLNNQITRI